MSYTCLMEKKQLTSMRLSPTAKRLLRQLANKLGISQAAVSELALRHLARHEHIREGDSYAPDQKHPA